jgi:hypothetical protein
MNRILLSLLVIIELAALVGGQQPKSLSVPRKVNLKGYRLQLEHRAGQCVLIYSGRRHQGELKMSLPAPCEFLRNYAGGARSFTYPDIGNATVLMAVGGPVDPGKTDALMKEGCGTRIQAILLRRSGVSLSQQTFGGQSLNELWLI